MVGQSNSQVLFTCLTQEPGGSVETANRGNREDQYADDDDTDPAVSAMTDSVNQTTQLTFQPATPADISERDRQRYELIATTSNRCNIPGAARIVMQCLSQELYSLF